MQVLLILLLFLQGLIGIAESRLAVTTCDRIVQHGYPCENHTVTTSDGYLLTMFRIPHSHGGDDQNTTNKPAVLLMHCLFGSSDMWLLNGPDNGLPYMLADAGYDVWIGNARGNVYSEHHMSFSPWSSAFWDFSLDEIAQYDVPAKIEYITTTSGQERIHYVGFSQGTTVFMMLLSKQPSYNQKIKTSHMLGPGVFLCHMKSPLAVFAAHVGGQPIFSRLGKMSTQTVDELVRSVLPRLCKWVEPVCIMAMDWLTGWGSPHLNRTLLDDLLRTTPADVSIRQLLQYLQHISSCEFKAFDYGYYGNMRKYHEPHPPLYNLQNVQPQSPINLYYSDNDFFVSLKDIQDLHRILGDRISLHRIKYPKFNHFDFAVAENIKDVINSCVVDKIQLFEGRAFNGTLCNNFRNKPF